MLLIDPIAWYLQSMALAIVWFLEAGHTVLPQKAGYDVGWVEAGHIYRHNIIPKLNCGATPFLWYLFFCLVCGRFFFKKKEGPRSIAGLWSKQPRNITGSKSRRRQSDPVILRGPSHDVVWTFDPTILTGVLLSGFLQLSLEVKGRSFSSRTGGRCS